MSLFGFVGFGKEHPKVITYNYKIVQYISPLYKGLCDLTPV